MKSRIYIKQSKTIFTLILLFIFANFSKMSAVNGVFTVGEMFYDLGSHLPMYATFDQNFADKQNVGISKLSFGFFDVSKSNPNKKIDNVLDARLVLGNLGIGYKYYKNSSEESYPIIDFSFIKTEFYTESVVSISSKIALLEKQTNYFSIKNYNWIGLNFNLGYNFLDYKDQMILSPMLHFAAGLNTYKIDTLIFDKIDELNKSTQYSIAEYGAALLAEYKSIKIELDYTKFVNIGDIARTRSNAEISYNLWENKYSDYAPNEIIDYVNTFNVFFSYSNDKFDFAEGDVLLNKISNASKESMNFGISLKLGKLY